jgi:hypothetical protein
MRRAVVIMFVVALAATGCGSGSKAPGVASANGVKAKASAKPSLDPDERQRKFTQCLREHGVNVEDAEAGSGAIRITASAGPGGKVDVIKECDQYLPEGKLAEIDPATKEKFRDFAKCMREHGIDMPDPEADGGGALKKGDGPDRFNPDDPTFKAAEKACAEKLPGKGDGAGVAVSGG